MTPWPPQSSQAYPPLAPAPRLNMVPDPQFSGPVHCPQVLQASFPAKFSAQFPGAFTKALKFTQDA